MCQALMATSFGRHVCGGTNTSVSIHLLCCMICSTLEASQAEFQLSKHPLSHQHILTTSKIMPSPAPCLIKKEDIAVLITKHWKCLSMLSKDNIMSVNLDVAKPFLAELSMHTVRLNPGKVLSACTIAQVHLKTSKAIHTIINDMWGLCYQEGTQQVF